MAALLAKYPDLQPLAQRAFKTYVKSIYKQKDKEVFDVTKLPIDDYSASLGLPMTPQLRYLDRKSIDKKKLPEESTLLPEVPVQKDLIKISSQKESNNLLEESEEDEETLDLLQRKETENDEDLKAIENMLYVICILTFLFVFLRKFHFWSLRLADFVQFWSQKVFLRFGPYMSFL